tara:strand:+ start:6460 stop:6699 length:240 start_codon:yes stop_codon:yes gene_type:complete
VAKKGNISPKTAKRRKMKVKAKINKLSNFNAMNIPCSSLEFSELRDGKEINLNDKVADKMLAMGLIEKTKKNKTNKEKK